MWDIDVNDAKAILNGPVNVWHDTIVLSSVSDLEAKKRVNSESQASITRTIQAL